VDVNGLTSVEGIGMKTLWAVAISLPLLLAGPGDPPAAAASLTTGEQAMLAELLGQGVVGEPVAGQKLTPAFAPLRNGTWTYQIVGGKDAGQVEQHVVKRLERDPSHASWRYAVGSSRVLFIKQMGDGSLTFVTEQDADEGVISRYDPPEPGLLAGLAPGDSRTSSVSVQVSDLSDPAVVSHQGTLQVTYSYLGAYKVTTPLGTYDAALIKWAYKGKVGPANVQDTQYRFFAPNVGMIASVDHLDVSAFLLYQKQTKFGKLLAKVPQ
jgi:hypothetical protein